jgi:hypothetical protein
LKRLVAERDAELAAAAKRMTDLHEMLTQRDAIIRDWERRGAEQQRSLAELSVGIELRDSALASRGVALANHDSDMAEQQALIAELESRLDQAEATMAQYALSAQNESAALKEVLNSRSWKVTKPLRSAASLLRGKKNSG